MISHITPMNRPESAEEIANKVIAYVDKQVIPRRALSWDRPEPARTQIPVWLDYLPERVRDQVAKVIYKASGLELPKRETVLGGGVTRIAGGPLSPTWALIARYRAAGWYVTFDPETGGMWIAPAIAKEES